MKLCQFSGLPVNYLLLFFFVQSLLLYIYQYFLLNISHQSFQFYIVGSTVVFLCYLCGFRELAVDYFLYKRLKLAKFVIFLTELSLPQENFDIGILADNRDSVKQSQT